jgi:hypothetical protein
MYDNEKYNNEIRNDLISLIDEDNMHFLDPIYQSEMAINNYFSAIETHTEGRAYKNMIENLSYLNDDYNDKLYHFCVAIERYKINTGKLVKSIKNLKESYKTSTLYNHINYLTTQFDKNGK